MIKIRIWDRLEEIRIRNLHQIQSAISKDEIDFRIQQIKEYLVTVAFCLQRLIAPLE